MKRFDEIVGYEEEKKELIELCSLIKKRDALKSKGGYLPKGLFLSGPNGVGKTMLARAFINESKCHCIEINYNDIDSDEQFGSYLKDKFNQAKDNSPCIIFIDELDKIIGSDSYFFLPGNVDKSRILLNEINKHKDDSDVFLLFVANNKNRIDRAVLRSGRIDKTLDINLPNENERKAIISYYLSNKKINESIKIEKLSKIFKGLSGADIESIINDGLINSFVNKNESIDIDDIMNAYYDKIFKTSGKTDKKSKDELRLLASHEAGHAVMALLNDSDSLTCASIMSRGNAEGFVLNNAGNRTDSEDDLRNEIIIAMAGRVSEEIFCNKKTLGSCSDLDKARFLASLIVRNGGMVGFDTMNINLGGFYGEPGPSNSGPRISRMEEKEDKIIESCYDYTISMLSRFHEMHEEITNLLLKKKVLNSDDIEQLIKKYHLKSLPKSLYTKVAQRIGMYNRVQYWDLQTSFNLTYQEAIKCLESLQEDKLVSSNYNWRGYAVKVD